MVRKIMLSEICDVCGSHLYARTWINTAICVKCNKVILKDITPEFVKESHAKLKKKILNDNLSVFRAQRKQNTMPKHIRQKKYTPNNLIYKHTYKFEGKIAERCMRCGGNQAVVYQNAKLENLLIICKTCGARLFDYKKTKKAFAYNEDSPSGWF